MMHPIKRLPDCFICGSKAVVFIGGIVGCIDPKCKNHATNGTPAWWVQEYKKYADPLKQDLKKLPKILA